ncbi:MAG: hypothetical protein JWM74_1, partial [Myxococcaceae bacterium]|nr:hypothetical protein [Myxococcaceae bacterium]
HVPVTVTVTVTDPAKVPARDHAPAPATTATTDDLTLEAQLMESARHSLATDPATALLRTDDHRRSFPHGQLADERELIAIDALRRLGRPTEARTRGEALLRRDPSGLYAERVRSILATLP